MGYNPFTISIMDIPVANTSDGDGKPMGFHKP